MYQVSYARPSGSNITASNLYVEGLQKGVARQQAEQALEALFSSFGKIINSSVLFDKSSGKEMKISSNKFEKESVTHRNIDSKVAVLQALPFC